ncbi:hypothetical protein [Rubritalea tangerina]|uniref:hypothetical protein n=1 Tax=Rubritalea tangerina TaxID=430798 RepID=UPI003615118E
MPSHLRYPHPCSWYRRQPRRLLPRTILGAVCGSLGLTLAGVTGYTLCRLYGYQMLRRIYRDEELLLDMKATFHRHSVLVLLLSRAAPMFPKPLAVSQAPLICPFCASF